jgi:hypothetical protein
LPIDSTFHFGASTRYYIIRERPQTGARPIIEELEKLSEDIDAGGLLGLPETETELDVRIIKKIYLIHMCQNFLIFCNIFSYIKFN